MPDLRAEVEALAGRDLDGFFARYVDGDWPLVPCWGQAQVEAERRLAHLTPIAYLEGQPVLTDLVPLRRLARDPNAVRARGAGGVGSGSGLE